MEPVLAYCVACDEVEEHAIDDPGSCRCVACGAIQPLVRPLAGPLVALSA